MSDLERLTQALREVKFPGTERDIVSLGYLKSIAPDGGTHRITLELTSNQPHAAKAVERDAHYYLKRTKVPYELQVNVKSLGGAPAAAPMGSGPGADPLEKVSYKVAVSSAKGGVGKSTVAVNLAVALALKGIRVGLLDADIHGPSLPMMLGMQGVRPEVEGDRMIPVERHGVKAISIGLLIESDAAVVWRGPMVGKALEQLMAQVDWSGVDLLLLDLPPGTGDIQITLAQRTALDGGIIVTTPQDVALLDAVRGVGMFKKVNVPVLGIVENMSTFPCPHCGEVTNIFGSGGGRREAERLGVPLLAQLPIDPRVTAGGDRGVPIVAEDPKAPVSAAFFELAAAVLRELEIETPKP